MSTENKLVPIPDSRFGKLIPLTEATKIMSQYEEIRFRSSRDIGRCLRARRRADDASYFERNIRAFIIQLDTLEDYIKDARKHTNFPDSLIYLAVINASDKYIPTTVFALTEPDSVKHNFTIVANSTGQVPEHPYKDGRIKVERNKITGTEDVILELEQQEEALKHR